MKNRELRTKAGKFVLYWMQAAQRDSCNAALAKAITIANKRCLPLLIVFCIDDQIPETNQRHFHFMLEGLNELSASLQKQQLDLHFAIGSASVIIPKLATDASEIICDSGYLRWQRESRVEIYQQLELMNIPYTEVETEAIVPVQSTSPKEEYAAATIRPKLLKQLGDHLFWPRSEAVNTPLPDSLVPTSILMRGSQFRSFQELWSWVLSNTNIAPSPAPVSTFQGGYHQARKRLDNFSHHYLDRYHLNRGDPSLEIESKLSPYLHFGQISALEICLRILEYASIPPLQLPGMIRSKDGWEGLPAAVASYCEELIIRRELSFNFCFYNPDYDNYLCLPAWARNSLEKHAQDERPIEYSLDRLEAAATYDVYWNSAMREMAISGKMHNYMRMYWGKKVLEWTPDPETAFYWLLYLNNRYALDGRDPGSYTGIAWCFGKHDRPWVKRSIFGSVRYMNAKGLQRKFDMQPYVAKWTDPNHV